MTTSVNLINQIKRVLNRHSEDPYFGNTVIVDFKASGVIFRLIFEGTTAEIYDAFTSRIKVQMINGVFDDKGLTTYDVAFLVTASAKASGLEPSRADFFNAS